MPARVERYVLDVRPIGPPVVNGLGLAGRTFALTDDGRVARVLAERLVAAGAQVRFLASDDLAVEADGLLHLSPLAVADVPGAARETRRLFELARASALGGARWIVAASASGGDFGRSARGGADGSAGLLRTLAKEFPDVRVRHVDLDPAEPAERLAEHLYAELLADEPRVAVGWAGGVRRALQIVPADGAAGPDGPSLGPDAVLLVTGGARGITARVLVELARRYRCRLEVVGRTPEPTEAEPPALASARDVVALRRALLSLDGNRTPAEIERQVMRLQAARELRGTLEAARAAGATVRYHALDVGDRAAFGALLDRLYAEHGRLDGVIHGAGVLEDRWLRDKTPESFRRVFDTKVNAALTLEERLRDDVRFVVFFASVAGAFGNAGQVDYAAANDALDRLAWRLRGRLGNRVLSIDWGPWGGGGMVSEELERAYARRGVGLIPPDEGVRLLFQELGRADATQVILMRARPESLA